MRREALDWNASVADFFFVFGKTHLGSDEQHCWNKYDESKL